MPQSFLPSNSQISNAFTHICSCDRLTISPSLMEQLNNSTEPIERKLSPDAERECVNLEVGMMDEATFRWELNANPMATEKLAEGIRGFATDIIKLETHLNDCLEEMES